MHHVRLIIGHIPKIAKQVKLAVSSRKAKPSYIRFNQPNCALFVRIEFDKLSAVFILLTVRFIKIASIEHPALRCEHNCMQRTSSNIDDGLLWL